MSAREYFWGVELNVDKKEVVWDPLKEDEEDDDIDDGSIQHFLFLKQAVLGAGATDGERNIVEIAAADFDGNLIRQPLFSLKQGLNESTILDIGAQPPLTLTLTSGSGPIYLSGQHALELKDDDFDTLDDEASEEAIESPAKFNSKIKNESKKRPAAATVGPVKKAKVDKSEDSKSKGGNVAEKRTSSKDEEDEDDDLDFSIGIDDEDSSGAEGEGEDESEENEESSDDGSDESPFKPSKKSGKVNGAGPKGPTKKKKVDLESIKKLIMKSPNKPKKKGKFLNFLENRYQITDEQNGNDLWMWYRKTLQD